jgi:hypothetical protein
MAEGLRWPQSQNFHRPRFFTCASRQMDSHARFVQVLAVFGVLWALECAQVVPRTRVRKRLQAGDIPVTWTLPSVKTS